MQPRCFIAKVGGKFRGVRIESHDGALMFITHAPFVTKNRAALVDFLEDNIRMRRWMFDPKTRMDAITQLSDTTKIPAEIRERTELVQALVEQSNAHAQYHAQDVKHRVAMIALQQLHATAFGSPTNSLDKTDVLAMANTVERYLEESGDLDRRCGGRHPYLGRHADMICGDALSSLERSPLQLSPPEIVASDDFIPAGRVCSRSSMRSAQA